MEDVTPKATKPTHRPASRLAHSPTGNACLFVLATIALLIMSALTTSANEREYGEYLSSQCATCHQRSGKARGIPSIIGWDRESFVAIMTAYKRKERENKVMQTIAGSLSDEDISALAAYFGSLKSTE